MKAILLSIRPEHAYNIIKGRKTLELRKRVPKDYVGWVYCYITKGERLSVVHDDEIVKTYYYLNSHWGRSLNQDIPFRFWFDEYETLDVSYSMWTNIQKNIDMVKKLCLTHKEIENYSWNGIEYKNLYAWHIKKLDIFDKPMQLSELYGKQKITKAQLDFISRHQVGDENYEYYRLTKAPKSYQYVWVKE